MKLLSKSICKLRKSLEFANFVSYVFHKSLEVKVLNNFTDNEVSLSLSR